MNIGAIIRSLREQNKVTQEELGKYLGVQRSAVANYESGKRAVDIITCEKIANYFDVSIDYLLGNDKEVTKDFVYNAKAYFLSDNIPQDEKDKIVKEVMDFYFKSKGHNTDDKKNSGKDS